MADGRAACNRWLEQLLQSLTVEEKVGQIIQADVAAVTAEDVRKYRLGSVLNGGNSAPGGDDLCAGLHAVAEDLEIGQEQELDRRQRPSAGYVG